ncbi:hypothetical protein [Mesomycoplasma ovipneumoniae]|uniref:hypothetical protein n=1 Tax=Mesomycoplasma ovipneumoniae TaxID=29562 RepID=UPI0028AC475E|nr:hypothetical protein [Mesomycoplasma ovipneumoniae]WNM15205.1 hypothetical protein RNM01_01050 [Mesomycoplasma ovipneumoniae]
MYFYCFLSGKKVQIRIAKNNFVDWQNEENFIQNDPNFLFYQKGNYIEKWIEGQILDSENLDFYIKKLFTELSKFHQQKIKKLVNLIDKLTKLTMQNTKN